MVALIFLLLLSVLRDGGGWLGWKVLVREEGVVFLLSEEVGLAVDC